VALVQFTGTPVAWERIFDFGGSTSMANTRILGLFRESDTGALRMSIQTDLVACDVVSPAVLT